MENLDSPPPKIKDGKILCCCPWPDFILDSGDGGFTVPFYSVQECSLGRNKWKTYIPSPPKIKDGKMASFFLLCSFILDSGVGGGRGSSDGGLLFHFILSKIEDKMMTDNIKVD